MEKLFLQSNFKIILQLDLDKESQTNKTLIILTMETSKKRKIKKRRRKTKFLRLIWKNLQLIKLIQRIKLKA
jgi:hypothetical protein